MCSFCWTVKWNFSCFFFASCWKLYKVPLFTEQVGSRDKPNEGKQKFQTRSWESDLHAVPCDLQQGEHLLSEYADVWVVMTESHQRCVQLHWLHDMLTSSVGSVSYRVLSCCLRSRRPRGCGGRHQTDRQPDEAQRVCWLLLQHKQEEGFERHQPRVLRHQVAARRLDCDVWKQGTFSSRLKAIFFPLHLPTQNELHSGEPADRTAAVLGRKLLARRRLAREAEGHQILPHLRERQLHRLPHRMWWSLGVVPHPEGWWRSGRGAVTQPFLNATTVRDAEHLLMSTGREDLLSHQAHIGQPVSVRALEVVVQSRRDVLRRPGGQVLQMHPEARPDAVRPVRSESVSLRAQKVRRTGVE